MLSFWEKDAFFEYEYIIIGGGIVGLSTAAALIEKQAQAKILVLEKGWLPSGASTKNAGFACFGSLTEILKDLKSLGEASIQELVAKRWNGLQKLRQRLGDEALDYKNWGGSELIFEKNPELSDQIASINDLLFPIFKKPVYQERQELITQFALNSDLVETLIFNPWEGQLHPGKMMKSLMTYVQERGVSLMNATMVKTWENQGDKIQIQAQDLTSSQNLNFQTQKLAICTNAFTPNLLPNIKLLPGRGQVLITQTIPNLALKGTFHFDEGYYYFRNYQNRVVFGGGRNLDFEGETSTELKTTPQIMADLETKLRELILPSIPHQIEMQWAGIMAFSPEHQPILENIEENIVLGTALNGMGVAIGSQLGEDIAQRLLD